MTKTKSAYAIQRAKWIAEGLCGIDGKAKIWKGRSTCECKKHFLYFKKKSEQYAAAAKKKAGKKSPAKKQKPAPKAEAPAPTKQVVHDPLAQATPILAVA
jgi:hypothetical protein